MKKNLIKWTLVWLGIMGVMFTNTTNAYSTVTPWTNGDIYTLTVCDPNNSGNCITMMDRNLWATTNDITSTWSYGDYYKWWNNQWYSSDSDDFSSASPWTWTEWEEWPCPSYYHVPSEDEWANLVNMWVGSDVWWKLNSWQVWQFQSDFKIPFAGYRYMMAGGPLTSQGNEADLWSSTSDSDGYPRNLGMNDFSAQFSKRTPRVGLSVRCFKNPDPVLISTTNDSTTTTIWWNDVTWLPTNMTVTKNTISTVEWKLVAWEVNVDFWTDESVTFSHPVQVNIPVNNVEQVIVKVKHWWDSTYGFAWLTRNSNASCDNWNVVATNDRYNWWVINVTDWYVTIYSCAASSFIAVGVENGWEPQVIVNIWQFNWWQNTCTWSNFIFENIQADKTSRDYELTWVFECAFGDSQSKTVTLQLSGNLVADGDRVISGVNVQMKNSEWTSSPVWLKFANTLSAYQALIATKTLFQKTGSMIWIASWVVSIQITVPAWTPDGTYNWTLVLTY